MFAFEDDLRHLRVVVAEEPKQVVPCVGIDADEFADRERPRVEVAADGVDDVASEVAVPLPAVGVGVALAPAEETVSNPALGSVEREGFVRDARVDSFEPVTVVAVETNELAVRVGNDRRKLLGRDRRLCVVMEVARLKPRPSGRGYSRQLLH
ncbi:hypothetical protein C440_03703 [Haloferax mucosum ATCC BAA-1512]|uniref:Uncharacterized protein n=1 Tax=Haloferax mucosum ATCC BAA-1512 TaxID=662479 RepID=M0ILW1_9EURY|nr:hypothetical protein C440_03703 [Haloferax mucosum ATCC BAA-1512]